MSIGKTKKLPKENIFVENNLIQNISAGILLRF